MNEEIKKALEALRGMIGKNVDAGARLDVIEKAAEARVKSATELRAEIDQLKEQMTEREESIKEIQKAARLERIELDPARQVIEAREIFGMQIRQQLCRVRGSELPAQFKDERERLIEFDKKRATLEAGAVTGSYTVPTLTESSVIDALEELSPLLPLVDFMPGLPGNVNIPVLATRPTMQSSRATVDTTMTQSDPAFSRVQLTPAEAYVYFPIDNRLLLMSAIALGALAEKLCRDSIIEGLSNWLVNADGTASYNSLTGILNEATYVTAMDAGNTAFGNVNNSALNKVLAAMLKRGRSRATFVMGLFVQGVLEDLSRQGRVKVITVGENGDARCKFRPIVIDEEMPDEAADGADVAFMGIGDLATYIVGLQGGITVQTSTDYKFGENQTCFRSVINMDMKRKPINTFRTLKTAAA